MVQRSDESILQSCHLLTSPLLPPTLTMVTPALLLLPLSSPLFSCGLSTRPRLYSLRSSAMMFFDWEEPLSSTPEMTGITSENPESASEVAISTEVRRYTHRTAS